MRPQMPPVSTPDNKFHDGNPLTGEMGTIVTADHLNNEQDAIRDIQGEIIAVLTAAGTAPDSTAGQLLAALKLLFAEQSGTLGALAALTGAPNKLAYFTGANAASLTDLTSVGRDILAAATKAAVLEYLGLGDVQASLKYGAPLIGELVMWSRPEMPQEIWPDMKLEFIPYMAQSFDPVKYPLLAALHPSHMLPADMRGQVPRGWDNTRGIDPGRALMSEQGDAMRKLTGVMNNSVGSGLIRSDGILTGVFKRGAPTVNGTPQGGSLSGSADPVFDNELVTPVAAENRMKNVAWNMIVRAK